LASLPKNAAVQKKLEMLHRSMYILLIRKRSATPHHQEQTL
jgi:hypothetical protein